MFKRTKTETSSLIKKYVIVVHKAFYSEITRSALSDMFVILNPFAKKEKENHVLGSNSSDMHS